MERSPLDLAAGWYPRPRGLSAWPLYQGLGALGRRLVDVLLERAQWKPSEVWILGHRVELQVGQLLDSEEELARRCGRGTSRKVVRTALRCLEAGGFLDRRPALSAGQCPYVITILDYALLRDGAKREGPQNGQPEGQLRASRGPARGQQGAPLEQGKHGRQGQHRNPGNGSAPASAASDFGEGDQPLPRVRS